MLMPKNTPVRMRDLFGGLSGALSIDEVYRMLSGESA